MTIMSSKSLANLDCILYKENTATFVRAKDIEMMS